MTDHDNARAILESIGDNRMEHGQADDMISAVVQLPAESLRTIIDVAAALAVTVRDELRAPQRPRKGVNDREPRCANPTR